MKIIGNNNMNGLWCFLDVGTLKSILMSKFRTYSRIHQIHLGWNLLFRISNYTQNVQVTWIGFFSKLDWSWFIFKLDWLECIASKNRNNLFDLLSSFVLEINIWGRAVWVYRGPLITWLLPCVRERRFGTAVTTFCNLWNQESSKEYETFQSSRTRWISTIILSQILAYSGPEFGVPGHFCVARPMLSWGIKWRVSGANSEGWGSSRSQTIST